MKQFGIALALVFGTILLPDSIAQTNALPPPPSPPPPPLDEGQTWEDWQASQTNMVQLAGQPYWIGEDGTTNYIKVYPFLLVTGVDTNGKSILVAPPEWMLEKPKPTFVVTLMKDLTGDEIEMEITMPTATNGFMKTKVEMRR